MAQARSRDGTEAITIPRLPPVRFDGEVGRRIFHALQPLCAGAAPTYL